MGFELRLLLFDIPDCGSVDVARFLAVVHFGQDLLLQRDQEGVVGILLLKQRKYCVSNAQSSQSLEETNLRGVYQEATRNLGAITLVLDANRRRNDAVQRHVIVSRRSRRF